MADSNTLAADEMAELQALQRQMNADQGQPSPQPQPQPQPTMQPPDQQVPIPQYDAPPPVLPEATPAPAPNQGWHTQAEQQQAQQQQQPGGQPPPGMIEERRRRQDAEDRANRYQQQLEENRLQMARLEERTSMLGDVVARGQKAQLERDNPIPSWEEDPEGFIRETNKRAVEEAIKERLKPFEEKQQQYDSVLQEERESREIAMQLQAQARQFEQQHPDFKQAYDFYQQARRQDLLSQGFPADRVTAHVDMEERIMARAHLQDGRNIADAVYKAALSRGYKPGQAPTPPPAPAQNGQPGTPVYQQQAPQYVHAAGPAGGYGAYQPVPAAQPGAVQPQPAPQYHAPPPPMQPHYSGQPGLDNMQAGMMAGAHLSDIGPSTPSAAAIPTLEQLVAMPEDQLEQNKAFVDAHIQGLMRAGH